ncbi:aspartate/glutamate racemase family protein [Fulvimarina endophytica]|uniref:Aspartate/glutamate racemase family protein n=1 Tax=Fulvimarina endophytica TaxID=2293836 RepID=A0A371X9R6_9HYPH|nr:aspartate/glutamate racemase family protein [Fulvimarina endophytica]RFC65970.1 aspartate/glutamate racemase family protein [Fulvimarina endophytica]
MTVPSIALINPNTSLATTDRMVAVARAHADDMEIVGLTADRGEPFISDERALGEAATVVGGLHIPRFFGGVIVAAFGDPGVPALKHRLDIPVIGIAEASMTAAAEHRRPFAIATTTPSLHDAIARLAADYGFDRQLVSIRTPALDPMELMQDPALLREELFDVVERCIRLDKAEAVIIGGGPLADIAQSLSSAFDTEIIEPIPSAVAAMRVRLQRSGTGFSVL